jgi:glycosyltransferase involved in cell wall biosynthesis
MSSSNIAAIILTKNEEVHLPACLNSLREVADEIYVVDSGSKDRTVEIAKAFGARVLEHEFLNHAAQLNWALEAIETRAEWIFRIDADERVSGRLAGSLSETLRTLEPEVTGVEVARRIQFLGRRLRWGGTYPVWLLRLWRRGRGRCEDTWMDEHIVLDGGKVVRVAGDLIHEIPKSLSEWTRKHDWYAERECRDILAPSTSEVRLHGQAGLKRLLKQQVYLRLPLFHRAFLYWVYRYFFRLGFLDGKEGLIYHFLQALWYRFLVDAKLYEIQRLSGRTAAELIRADKDAIRTQAH